jgi:hypothetical protein
MKKFSLAATISLILMTTTSAASQHDVVNSRPTATMSTTQATESNDTLSAPESSTSVEIPESAAAMPMPASKLATSVEPTKSDAVVPSVFQGVNAVNERAMAARERQKLAEVGGYGSLSVAQQGTKGKYYDPMPRNIVTYTTSFTYEYTPNTTVSFGITPSFSKSKTRFLLLTEIEDDDSYSLSPFVSYFLSSQWLLSAQGSVGYSLSGIDTFLADSDPTSLDQRGLSYSGSGYITWLTPDNTLNGTVSIGATYSSQYSKAAVDNTGSLSAASKFQRAGPSLSGSLNYKLADAWVLSFQASVDYSLKVTRRSTDYRPGGGRQSLRVAAGPSISNKFTKDVACSLGYTHTEGYGFYRENQIALQVRILF